eukprot:m.38519 g.38519  ORF g.38519 m.38519 type:complete len:728 (+) comp5890_c0_seq1:4089-6272(+)
MHTLTHAWLLVGDEGATSSAQTVCTALGRAFAAMAEQQRRRVQSDAAALRRKSILRERRMSAAVSFDDLVAAGNRHLRRDNAPKAIQYFEAALRSGSTDLPLLAAVHYQLANCYWSVRQDAITAIAHLKKSAHIAKKCSDDSGLYKSYSTIAMLHRETGSFARALDYGAKSLAVAKSLGEKELVALECDNLGNIYHNLGNQCAVVRYPDTRVEAKDATRFNNAHDLFAKHFSAAEMNKTGQELASMGTAFDLANDPMAALSFHQRRLAKAISLGDRAAEGRAHCNMGNSYRALGKLHEALACYERDLAISKELKDVAGQGISYSNLGSTHQALGHVEKAVECHEAHVQILLREGDLAGLGAAYGNLAYIYEALGDYPKACEYHREHLNAAGRAGDRVSEAQALAKLNRAKELMETGSSSSDWDSIALGDAPRALKKNTIRGTLSNVLSSAGGSLRRAPKQRGSLSGVFGGDGLEMSEMGMSVGSPVTFDNVNSTKTVHSTTASTSHLIPDEEAALSAGASPVVRRRMRDRVSTFSKRISTMFGRSSSDTTTRERSYTEGMPPRRSKEDDELNAQMSYFQPAPGKQGESRKQDLGEVIHSIALTVEEDSTTDAGPSQTVLLMPPADAEPDRPRSPLRIDVKPSPNPKRKSVPPEQMDDVPDGEDFVAVYDYTAAEDGELSFRVGDEFVDVKPLASGWYYGTLQRTGEQGLFPSNYVRERNGVAETTMA